MKSKVDKKILLFVSLVVIIAGVTFFNIYLDKKNEKAPATEEIINTNKELRTELNVLKEENKKLVQGMSNVVDDNKQQKLVSSANEFITTAFVRKSEGYEERKSVASKIMSEELLSYFYPSETYEFGEKYTSEPTEMNFYVQHYQPEQTHAIVIVEFINVAQTEVDTERTKNVLKLYLEQESDIWRVVQLEEILLNVIKEV